MIQADAEGHGNQSETSSCCVVGSGFPRGSHTQPHTQPLNNNAPTSSQVPGIGPAAAKALASGDDPNEKITNTFQLIGK